MDGPGPGRVPWPAPLGRYSEKPPGQHGLTLPAAPAPTAQAGAVPVGPGAQGWQLGPCPGLGGPQQVVGQGHTHGGPRSASVPALRGERNSAVPGSMFCKGPRTPVTLRRQIPP